MTAAPRKLVVSSTVLCRESCGQLWLLPARVGLGLRESEGFCRQMNEDRRKFNLQGGQLQLAHLQCTATLIFAPFTNTGPGPCAPENKYLEISSF